LSQFWQLHLVAAQDLWRAENSEVIDHANNITSHILLLIMDRKRILKYFIKHGLELHRYLFKTSSHITVQSEMHRTARNVY